MCVKAEKFSLLLRVTRAKTIWGAVYIPPPWRKISWQATPREIGLNPDFWVDLRGGMIAPLPPPRVK